MEKIIPKQLIIAIALLQGLLLLALYKSIQYKFWPSTDEVSLNVAMSLVISLPVMAMLSAWSDNLRDLSKWLALFGLCLALVAAYTGYQQKPATIIHSFNLLAPFALTVGIACFKALMYIQQRASNEPVSYNALFRLSWRNFLILGLATIFCAIFWGILMLLAGLFESIKIKFFIYTFTQAWFYFPAISIAGGVAIFIFRNMTSVIDMIAKLLQALIKYLLPLVIFVALLFLAALLTSGLELLWKTGTGSIMVLWLLAIILFFVNTVYQDKSDIIPYSLALHRFIYIGIAVLPLYVLIAAYGLYLRISQYGWSLGRCWGVLVCSLLALFIFGYVWGIIKKRDAWIGTLSQVNIVMSIVVLVSAILINSPLLDFRKIVVSSQMARIESGKNTLSNLDIYYFSRNLARPGYLALQSLKTKIKDTNPQLAKGIDAVYTRQTTVQHDITAKALRARMTTSPTNLNIPPELMQLLLKQANTSRHYSAVNKHYYLIQVDLDGAAPAEYIALEDHVQHGGYARLWYQVGKSWKSIYMTNKGRWPDEKLKALVENKQFSTLSPRWQRFKIGNIIFSANDE